MSELEEARMLLDTAERARRGIEGEIGDTRESIGALTNTNALLAVDKRRLEGDIRCVHSLLYILSIQSPQYEQTAFLHAGACKPNWTTSCCR